MVEATVLLALVLTVWFTGMAGIWWYNRPVKHMPRPDNRIPARERELLGDDWTAHVKSRFHG